MLQRVETEAPKVATARWYLEADGLHLLLPGGMFLSTSLRCLSLMGYDGEHPGRALKQLVEDGDAVLIELPPERGGVGPLLTLTVEEVTSLLRDFSMPIGKGFRPVHIAAERWGRA